MSRWVGASVRRVEDPRFLSGKATFLEDIRLPGTLYTSIVRSPYAHATVRGVDAGDAMKAPGVVAVVTGQDVKKATNPIPSHRVIEGMKHAACYALSPDKVRFVGDPVVAVVATDRYLAEDAAELVRVEYEQLPPVVDAEKALAEGAPLLYEEWKDNVMLHYRYAEGDLDRVFQEADLVVKERLWSHRYTGTPIENRAYLASYDRAGNTLTLWATTQRPHMLRTILAQTLGMPENRIRVITPYIGGGFGVKLTSYPEEPLMCHLSMATGRPVVWVEDRQEHLATTIHAREQVHYIQAAVRKDGRILGLKDRIIVDFGHYLPCDGFASPLITLRSLPGPYKIENYFADLYVVVTNKANYGAYRGIGKADSNFIMERMMDIIACELKMDPAEIRLKNFIQPHEFPYPSVTGLNYDSGNYPTCLQKALEMIGYKELREEQKRRRERGEYMGIGVVYMLEPVGAGSPDAMNSGYDSAMVRIDPLGNVTVLAGVIGQIGQGHETTLAQVAADELGVHPTEVVVLEGDTATCPYGLGAWSSRAPVYGAPAVMLASRRLKDKVLKIAANMLETRPEDLQLKPEGIFVKEAPERRVTLKDVAKVAYTALYRLPEGVEPTLEASYSYMATNIRYTPDEKGRINPYPSYPNGAFAAVVNVDAETGQVKIMKFVAVHDCGVLINPMIVEGQIQGGVAQGVGGVMTEEIRYDENGQLLTRTFMDYLVPTSLDLPDIEVAHVETPSPFNPGGFKGCGESGACGASPCIVNAVQDALAPMGVRIREELPLTPDRVFRLIQAAKGISSAK